MNKANVFDGLENKQKDGSLLVKGLKRSAIKFLA